MPKMLASSLFTLIATISCFSQKHAHAAPTPTGCTKSMKSPIHLIVPIQVYNRSRVSKADLKNIPLRMQELDEALLGNLRNAHVTKIHIVAALDERVNEQEDNEKLRPVPFDFLQERGFRLPKEARNSNRLVFLASSVGQTLRSVILYTNENICPGSIMMMSSSDIYWTDSVRFLRLLRDKGDEVFALSRHDMVSEHPMSYDGCPSDTVLTRNQCFDYAGGHDGFAFRVPLRIEEDRLSKFDIPLGVSMAENTVIALLRANGYSVKNPCVDIRGIHFHCSLVRMHTSIDDPKSDGKLAITRSPNAWDMIGGEKALSKELGEEFVQRVHGFAPPMTVMDLCIERPGCWTRAIAAGFSHPEREHVVVIKKHYFSGIKNNDA